ncbi:MAG TPA: hypothetical protein VHV51_19245 [Polyangiaceae bacterium]|jgi:hypothetical protein|nr:hypothetical protein [Polyangiaceae bacterium]
MDARAIAGAVGSYLKDHPEELWRLLRNALALRFGVPLAALRWMAQKGGGKKAPKDVQIEAVPPGVRLSASLDLMGTPVRASGVMFVERVRANAAELVFELRLAEVSLKVTDDNAATPIAALLKSGALDLSKPGNLAAYMPKRPPILIDARDDRVVIDLMKHPKFAGNENAQRLVRILAPLVTVSGIETGPEHLDVAFRPFPDGVADVISRVRNLF